MSSKLNRKFADMVWRIDSHAYEVRSLPNGAISPEFNRREDAERWLSENLERLGLDRVKRGPRACMTCGHGFESEGIHNRMCGACRLRASHDQDAPFSFGAIHGRKRA
jgi:hypothetical protein